MSVDALADLTRLARSYREDPARTPGYAKRMRPATSGHEGLRSASVLVLFGVLDDVPAKTNRPGVVPEDLDLLLVLRADTLRHHAGEIAFPGGGADPGDADVVATALREAEEETGLDPDGVRILGVLPQAPTVSRFAVTPVLGWWERQSPIGVVDLGESAQVFRAPVADLVDPAVRGVTRLQRRGMTLVMDAFRLDQGLLWGFTAGIVSSLLTELGWDQDWDREREFPVPGF
ncbi:CoA pyrophosphatase [Galactobacter sp.]|uniref:NUDIX hydrolase n=1 Tax=Galactobacter sp. TaxID=2676125 RepID=UPI0025C557BB|nr:CoA pyrophosphatase [Galactobacter sp.]